MIIGRFRGRESSFLSSRLFAKVTTCRGRFANHSPLILQKSFLPTNILIYAAEPFIFSTFAWFFTSERPGSSNRLTRVVQSNDPPFPDLTIKQLYYSVNALQLSDVTGDQ